ncbi:MAG: type II toxin-antitoxin system HicB family antitoxin [Desulfococcaceae bacterium]
MKYQAIIKKTDKWWIGWLLDLPGVNAQEKTGEELIESLIIGAGEMLSPEVPFEPDSIMTTVDIPEQSWMRGLNENVRKF